MDKNHGASWKAEIRQFIWILQGKMPSCHTSYKRKFEQHITEADRGPTYNELWIYGPSLHARLLEPGK